MLNISNVHVKPMHSHVQQAIKSGSTAIYEELRLENLHSLTIHETVVNLTTCSPAKNEESLHARAKDRLMIFASLSAFYNLLVYSQLVSSDMFHSLLLVGHIMHFFQPG